VHAPASFVEGKIVEKAACVRAEGAAGHARPALGEEHGDGSADAARGTGNDRQASVERPC
jgi:hypothetical protein